MIHIGWLVNGTFYPLFEKTRVDRLKSYSARNIDIVEVFAEREPCIKY